MDTVSHKQTNTNTKQTKRQSKLKQGWFGPVIATNKRYENRGKQETKIEENKEVNKNSRDPSSGPSCRHNMRDGQKYDALWIQKVLIS